MERLCYDRLRLLAQDQCQEIINEVLVDQFENVTEDYSYDEYDLILDNQETSNPEDDVYFYAIENWRGKTVTVMVTFSNSGKTYSEQLSTDCELPFLQCVFIAEKGYYNLL